MIYYLDIIAMSVGYTALFLIAFCMIGIATVSAILTFPIRFDFKRDTPSFLDTPNGPHNLNLFMGIGSRRRMRWTFGLMLWDREGTPARRAKVTATKRESHRRGAVKEF